MCIRDSPTSNCTSILKDRKALFAAGTFLQMLIGYPCRMDEYELKTNFDHVTRAIFNTYLYDIISNALYDDHEPCMKEEIEDNFNVFVKFCHSTDHRQGPEMIEKFKDTALRYVAKQKVKFENLSPIDINNILGSRRDAITDDELACGIYYLLDKLHVLIILDYIHCLLYTSPSPRDRTRSRMPSSA